MGSAADLTQAGHPPRQLRSMARMDVQDVPTSARKTGLVIDSQEVLLWTGSRGTIGVLIPLTASEDAEFLPALGKHMRRSEDLSALSGRDDLAKRSYHAPPPIESVVDGDLCERFSLLPQQKKGIIANLLGQSVEEIQRRVLAGFASSF
ncbi:pre-mRNA-splicing factor rse1 [Conoideocrella luteorostrata]|uniref:Pre-mRNA-splicing factor rse1 n=1 Tax=Conoideocrella luteorostrata TaxID=1105319 RepID=A0AAJ0CCH6_9HYPO|nr:pre-mRNA-splicing factor rse1 [Conoideocrella luteorostrata]